MRTAYLFLLCLPAGLLAQGQYDIEPPPYPDQGQYSQYNDHIEVTRQPPEEQFQYQSQQQVQQEVIQPPTPENPETEPTEPGPLDCREEQYPCTRLYSVHKPCKQCLNQICFYRSASMEGAGGGGPCHREGASGEASVGSDEDGRAEAALKGMGPGVVAERVNLELREESWEGHERMGGRGVALSSPSHSLRRIYVINKEICVRTVCAHEELLRGKGSPNPRPHSGPTVGAPACREVGGGCPCVGPFPMFTVLGPPPPRPPAPH
uniref:Microfibrillar-associated protein 2 n=1 Tax=Ornithorhynchus anatinus TaxID=9258 RepID=A0A6I8PCU8_ORNAN